MITDTKIAAYNSMITSKRKYFIFKCIVFIILILPIFYEYFDILPKAAKYILDISLVVYFVNTGGVITKMTSFAKLYKYYIILILLITIISLVIHEESIFFLLQESRRLIFPLLLYFIFSDIIESYPGVSVKIHKLLLTIVLIQVPLTVFQTILFPYLKRYGVYVDAGHINVIDIACGTMGAGGTSILGSWFPLVVIYLYDLKLLKHGLWLVISVFLINSGGGIILFFSVLLLLTFYSFGHGSVKNRFKAISGMIVMIILIYFASGTDYFIENTQRYERSFLMYNEVFIKKGAETFGGVQSHKIDRFNGHKFLRKKMDPYLYEPVLGLGFEFQQNDDKKPFGFKNDLNTVIAERGLLGLFLYVIFFLLLFKVVYDSLKQERHKAIFVKVLFFVVFFLGGLYNQSTRYFQIWLFVVYFIALLEHRSQYQFLLNFTSGYKHSNSRSQRRV